MVLDPSQVLPEATSWWYFSAILLLGMLHGFEPGHSKAMTGAFILAIRGTVRQAVVLGLSTAIVHTGLIWLVITIALRFREKLNMGGAEPLFRLVSGVLIIGMACWMFFRIRRHRQPDSAVGKCCEPAQADLREKYQHRNVSFWQVMLFGCTGGLLLCPSSIAVLLLCLQSGKLVLGLPVVLAFGAGLAVTLVSVACAIAWGTGHALRRFGRAAKFLDGLPYLSVFILIVLGGSVAGQGIIKLMQSRGH